MNRSHRGDARGVSRRSGCWPSVRRAGREVAITCGPVVRGGNHVRLSRGILHVVATSRVPTTSRAGGLLWRCNFAWGLPESEAFAPMRRRFNRHPTQGNATPAGNRHRTSAQSPRPSRFSCRQPPLNRATTTEPYIGPIRKVRTRTGTRISTNVRPHCEVRCVRAPGTRRPQPPPKGPRRRPRPHGGDGQGGEGAARTLLLP